MADWEDFSTIQSLHGRLREICAGVVGTSGIVVRSCLKNMNAKHAEENFAR